MEWHDKPDWAHWENKLYLDPWECTALASDLTPETYVFAETNQTTGQLVQRALHADLMPQDLLKKYYRVRDKFGNSAIIHRKEFAQWALSEGWTLPAEFLRIAGIDAPDTSLKIKWCYLSDAAHFFADRQLKHTTMKQAVGILTRMGGYLQSGEHYPYPVPDRVPDENDGQIAMALIHGHRIEECKKILRELREAKKLELYDPATLLKISPDAKINDPYIDVDEVAKQIIEHSKIQAESADIDRLEDGEGAVKGITKRKVMNAFEGLRFDYDHWGKNLATPPEWLKPCRVMKGNKKASAIWNPILIAVALHDKGILIGKLNAVFFNSLKDWADDWREESAKF